MWIIKDNLGNILQYDTWTESSQFKFMIGKESVLLSLFLTEKSALCKIAEIEHFPYVFFLCLCLDGARG